MISNILWLGTDYSVSYNRNHNGQRCLWEILLYLHNNYLLEKKKYEAELRERTLRASKGSRHSVDDMLQRQHELSEKSREKFLKKKENLDTQIKEKADQIIKKRHQHFRSQ